MIHHHGSCLLLSSTAVCGIECVCDARYEGGGVCVSWVLYILYFGSHSIYLVFI